MTQIEAAIVPQVYETTEMVEGARRLANQVSFFLYFIKHPFQRFNQKMFLLHLFFLLIELFRFIFICTHKDCKKS